MSQLFGSLYLDEDVSVLVGALLRAHGLDAKTALEAEMLGRSDAEQLAFAVGEGRVMVTHNRCDFEELAEAYRRADRHHHGIVIAVHRPERETVRRLVVLLDRLTADELERRLLYI